MEYSSGYWWTLHLGVVRLLPGPPETATVQLTKCGAIWAEHSNMCTKQGEFPQTESGGVCKGGKTRR